MVVMLILVYWNQSLYYMKTKKCPRVCIGPWTLDSKSNTLLSIQTWQFTCKAKTLESLCNYALYCSKSSRFPLPSAGMESESEFVPNDEVYEEMFKDLIN